MTELHTAARDAFKLWAESGRPRQGSLFEHKQATNAKYKYAVRFIKKNEDTLRADSLARKLHNNSCYDFLKEVKVINSCKTPYRLLLKECVGQTTLLNCGDNTIMSCSTVLRVMHLWLKRLTPLTTL